MYIPNPLRCFECQRFGHHEDRCTAAPVCAKCGKEGFCGVRSENCKGPINCVNCGKDHPAYSNKCEVWLKEKEIMKLKLKNNIPYPEALESPYHLAAVSGAHFTQGTILIVILVSSGSAKSRTHQSAVGGFLVTRRGWPGRLRECRIWTFINSV